MSSETTDSKVLGVIPDFFHDVIAYIIPGYVVIILVALDVFLFDLSSYFPFANEVEWKSLNWATVIFAGGILTIIAYVIGRFFEQAGYCLLHKWGGSPKWNLIFGNNSRYSEVFKKNVIKKIEKWLEEQSGRELMRECKECTSSKKDDYFNLIKFYLNERFPSFALYDKKQNASIESTRSLALIFGANALATALWVSYKAGWSDFPIADFYPSIVNAVFGLVLFCRFKRDKKYHAMYIFEVFIATKKLLKKTDKRKIVIKKNFSSSELVNLRKYPSIFLRAAYSRD